MTREQRFERRLAARGPVVAFATRRYLVWVPLGYRRIATLMFDGKPRTIRDIAAQTGYSRSGAHDALRAMQRLGIGVLTTARGRFGKTRFKVQNDVAVANVRTTDVSLSRETSEGRESIRSVVRTFTNPLFTGRWAT